MKIEISPEQLSPESDITESLQSAIMKVNAHGGGTVTVPAGHYHIACIRLLSNVELNLSHGCTLKGIPEPSRYPLIKHIKTPALFIAEDAENIAITGPGKIDGNGNSKRWEPDIDHDEFRFSIIRFIDCQDIRLQNLKLWWTLAWAVHLRGCQDVNISGCEIIGRKDRINSDGIDPDDCQRVRINNCRVCTGDDAIVIKSTTGGICEDILVTACILESACAAIKIGTESHGTIRNVIFSDCIVRDSNVGLSAYLKDGGTFKDIRMTGCHVEAHHDFPVLLDHTPRFYDEPKYGVMEGISITDCLIRSAGRLYIGGPKEAPVRGLTLRNIQWYLTGPCNYGPGVDRPLGAAQVRVDPDRHAVGETDHHMILEHVQDSEIRDIQLLKDHDEASARRILKARACHRLNLDIKSPSADTDSIHLEDCEDITQ